jgi:CRISPR-associated protein Cst2
MGTLVSIAPVRIVDDFGTMARQDGDPVPHEHQFYRANLQGLFSLDLSTAGTFFNGGRVGYRNLDEIRVGLAGEQKLDEVTVHGQPAFRLSIEERTRRVAALVKAIGELEGGAKLALHYTDVTPALIVCAVIKAGNNPFARIVRPDSRGNPEVSIGALEEILSVYKDQIFSELFVGWARGYLDDQRAKIEALSAGKLSGARIHWGHPREVMAQLAEELTRETSYAWYN